MAEIQKALTGALGATTAAVVGIGEIKERKEEKAAAKQLAEKREKQRDLEHSKKVELLDAKQEALSNEEKRKEAMLASKLKESEIKQKGALTAQSQEAEIRRAKLVEQRNRALTSVEKLKLMRAKAADSLQSARVSKREGQKAFKISDRLSKLQKKRRVR